MAPDGARTPYVTIGDTSADGGATGGYLGRPGSADGMLLHVWAPGPGREKAAAIHATLDRVLDRRALPLPDGLRMVTGRLTLVSSVPDPDGRTHHRVLRYRTLTLAPLGPVRPSSP